MEIILGRRADFMPQNHKLFLYFLYILFFIKSFRFAGRISYHLPTIFTIIFSIIFSIIFLFAFFYQWFYIKYKFILLLFFFPQLIEKKIIKYKGEKREKRVPHPMVYIKYLRKFKTFLTENFKNVYPTLYF